MCGMGHRTPSLVTCGRGLLPTPYLVREREGVVAVEVHSMRRLAEAQVSPLPGLAPVHVLNRQHLDGGARRRCNLRFRDLNPRSGDTAKVVPRPSERPLHALRVLFALDTCVQPA